jgi:hypothetical protein
MPTLSEQPYNGRPDRHRDRSDDIRVQIKALSQKHLLMGGMLCRADQPRVVP